MATFHIVIARKSLILTAAKGIEGMSIQFAENFCDIVAVVVCRTRNRMRRGDSGETSFLGWDHEAFVDIDFGVSGMIHGHERDAIVVVDFPKFGGDTQVVIAVVGHELIAANLVPLSGRSDFRRT
jgi:hypothetical protein